MKILLITSAGMSTRFSKSLGYPCLKCLYYRDDFRQSLLWGMLSRSHFFDKIVIVGGYKFSELKNGIQEHFAELSDKLIIVENPYFSEYGSGYSLFAGFEAIKDIRFDELVFAEGDLFVDDESFERICCSDKSVMTYNSEPIFADKAVAFYFDTHNKPHYIYDTSHGMLEIPEPFISVFNSAQIWKFNDPDILRSVFEQLEEKECEGTNLIPINKYFQAIESNKTKLIHIKKWINCNTVSDFNRSLGVIK